MKKPAILLAVAAALLAATASTPLAAQKAISTQEGDEVMSFSTEDAEMNAAVAQARETLPEWLAILADPPEGVTYIQFKYPLGGTEHIWVDQITREGDILVGRLANNPHMAGFALGDEVRVPLSEVTDWVYRDAEGVVQGNRTVRVVLGRVPPEQAADMRRFLGWTE